VRTIYKKILLAMDSSKDAFNAAEKVLNLVNNNKTEETKKQHPKIVAFHSIDHHFFGKTIPIAVPSGFGAGYNLPAVDYRKLEEEYKDHGRKILNKTKELFEKENIDIETRLITDEKPEEYIDKVVEKENFDLVVLGSKGEHSKLEQIFSGSVAQKVLNDINSDVLIVR
jgi:nucleotide-binding universal stress UspA family protein